MFDKLKKIKNFTYELEHSFENIIKICSSTYGNLILVNANTPFLLQLLLADLRDFEIQFYLPSLDEIKELNTIGNFLRTCVDKRANKERTLILDFAYELSNLDESRIDIVDLINVNRDLFALAFNNTIIIAEPVLTYAIMKYAFDFKSCLSACIDTTKWFCSPIMLPIVKVNRIVYDAPMLISLYKNNKKIFDAYVGIEEKISQLSSYSYKEIKGLVQKINDFPKQFGRYSLLLSLISNLINNRSNNNVFVKIINELEDQIFKLGDSIEFVDLKIKFAEFYYRYGEYQKAIFLYQNIVQILADTWENSNKDIIIAFLRCNILICKYMKKQEHAPIELLIDLNIRLNDEYTIMDARWNSFKRTYLFLVESTCQHHTFAQHKDIFRRLDDIDVTSVHSLDISESIESLYTWEQFINNNFQPIPLISETSVLSEIYVETQRMIYYFSIGDYGKSKSSYNLAIGLSNSYGYVEITKMIRCFRSNIIDIYERFININ